MGTVITLSLNGITIDWGKNNYWNGHYWLFPPGSLGDRAYRYADGTVETKAVFQTTLKEAYFRLCHLGYSHQETKKKFNAAVTRWNRTADLALTFEDFHDALVGVNFASLAPEDLKPYDWDFRIFVVHLLSEWDTEAGLLEDFVRGLDFALTLRVLADRPDSQPLLLQWHHQDLVDSGWASLEDLKESDRATLIINHTSLMGRLQDYARKATVDAFDKWLAASGLERRTEYLQLKQDGTINKKLMTLPSAVRNMIHHPENPHNDLSDDDLYRSLENLLSIARNLDSPLPGLIRDGA